MTDISLTKKVYSNNGNLINNQFTQLLNSTSGSQQTPELSVDDFFIEYNSIFYQILKDGDTNSHEYILQKEAEYLGVQLNSDNNIQSLLAEITSLRQELLDAQTTINNLTTATNNG